MAHTSNYVSLQNEIKLWAARSDTDFVLALPTFINMAEQRIAFGSAAPFPSDPVRVRDQKKSIDLQFTDGAADLPDDYLEQQSLTWDDDAGRKLNFRPEEEFDSLISLGGLPSVFTVKGAVILNKPESTGSAKFTYYAKFPELINDNDTNFLLQNTPSIYLKGSLIEAYGFTRNKEAQQGAYADYISAANALSQQTRKSLQAARMFPVIPGTNSLRRLGGF